MALARWVLGAQTSTRRVVLLVDKTSLRDKLKVLAVSLAYRGRAIPLAWWCYPHDRWPMAQVKLVRTLLDWVAPAIAPGTTVVVEMDRGLGNSPTLLRAIAQRGWYYLVRVTGPVRLRLSDGREVAFRDFKSGGWQWQKSRMTDPAHANRLWLVLALADAWVVSLGTQVLERVRWQREVTRGQCVQHRVFALGLRLLTRWMLRQRRVPLELQFILHGETA